MFYDRTEQNRTEQNSKVQDRQQATGSPGTQFFGNVENREALLLEQRRNDTGQKKKSDPIQVVQDQLNRLGDDLMKGIPFGLALTEDNVYGVSHEAQDLAKFYKDIIALALPQGDKTELAEQKKQGIAELMLVNAVTLPITVQATKGAIGSGSDEYAQARTVLDTAKNSEFLKDSPLPEMLAALNENLRRICLENDPRRIKAGNLTNYAGEIAKALATYRDKSVDRDLDWEVGLVAAQKYLEDYSSKYTVWKGSGDYSRYEAPLIDDPEQQKSALIGVVRDVTWLINRKLNVGTISKSSVPSNPENRDHYVQKLIDSLKSLGDITPQERQQAPKPKQDTRLKV